MKKLTVTFAFTLCLCTFTGCETESINDQQGQEYEQDIKSINAIDKNDSKEDGAHEPY